MPRLFTALVLIPCAWAANPTGNVSGIVVNDADRQPVRKAAVLLTSMTADHSFAVAITDSTGRFSLGSIPAGRYRLGAQRSGFLTIQYGAIRPQDPGTALNLAPAEQRTGITLHLMPSQSVSGIVTDGEGDPIQNIHVTFYKLRMERGKPHYFAQADGTTNAFGRYEVTGSLLPGQYWAMAQGRSMPAFRSHPVAIAGESAPAEVFAPQFYAHADRLQSATPVIVAAGRDTPNVDFRLNYALQVAVHGTVTGASEHARNISVRLDPALIPTDERRAGMQMNVDIAHPEFRMGGLIPGSYRATVQAGARRSVSDIQLSGADTELNVALQAGTPLSGSVKVEGASAGAGKNWRVNLSPGDGLASQAPLQTVTRDGVFSFPEVPAGIWDIDVGPLPDGAYIKSMRLGQKDVLLEDMEVGPNTKGSLTVVISMAAPKVEGTLETRGPATVLAAPTGTLAQVFSFYTTVQADEKGHFVIKSLNPGNYRFYAFQELEPGAWQDSGFLSLFEGQSKLLELKESATETLTLPVIGSARQ